MDMPGASALAALKIEVADTRRLYEFIQEHLPSIPFESAWLNRRGEPAAGVYEYKLPHASKSLLPDGRRVVFIPTRQFGAIVFFDLWPKRNKKGPVGTAHPEGFDLLDSPFDLMRTTPESVQEALTAKTIVVTDGLTNVFRKILLDLLYNRSSL